MLKIPPRKTHQKNIPFLPNLSMIGKVLKTANISKIAANPKLKYGFTPRSFVFIPKPKKTTFSTILAK